jgi:hypothetical protein
MSIFCSSIEILLYVFSSIDFSCSDRPVIQGIFCFHPLHVHLKFWDVSSLRTCLSAREMFVHSEQNFSSYIQHDKCSTSSYIIFSHFGQALLPIRCHLCLFTGVEVRCCIAIACWLWFINICQCE